MKETKKAALELSSPAFGYGTLIPKKHTKDGEDVSPPLEWKMNVPWLKSFALICEDPDAPGGVWIHWVIYNIPACQRKLLENLPKVEQGDFFTQGRNSWNQIGYNVPAPPPGSPHRDFFQLYALDISALPQELTAEELRKRIQGHVLAQGEWMGTYQRKQ